MKWLVLLLLGAVRASQQSAWSAPSHTSSVPFDLTPYANNKGVSFSGEHDGHGFDGEGGTFPAEALPQHHWRHLGVEFALPDWSSEKDNVKVEGQVVEVNPVEVSQVHFLTVGDGVLGFPGDTSPQEVKMNFEDGSEQILSLAIKTWWAKSNVIKGDIACPYRYLDSGEKEFNISQIFHMAMDVPPQAAKRGTKLVSLTLPPSRDNDNMHIFAISGTPVVEQGEPTSQNKITARAVVSTKQWEMHQGKQSRVIELTVANPWSLSKQQHSDFWLTSPVSISLEAPGLRTVKKTIVARLMPGEETVVEIWTTTGPTKSNGKVIFESGRHRWEQKVVIEGSIEDEIDHWEPTRESVMEHTAPTWFRDAKFGLFIHWGPYSVPAWAESPAYAEWYWFWLQTQGKDGPNYKHHLETYGPDFVYDDFIPKFDASDFNASAWAELFSDAGAKYFVLTTKHHDGFALFDTQESSNRNSLLMGPKRDLLKELLTAAKTEQPHLHRGTYFTMPEWFCPAYAEFGREQFPGGAAHNPYAPGELEPYTGYVEVDDYRVDIQHRQMSILAEEYETEIMWCDIGMANDSYHFAADWFAKSAREGHHVVMNDRCGVPGAFDTPEMQYYSTVSKATWESCMSLDPHSFGYSTVTNPEEYRDAKNIIHTLVDITAKGGNFLLNIGPTGTGKIIDTMANNLRGAGAWLKVFGEAVYDARAIPLLPEYITDSVDVRLTRSGSAVYLISFKRPTSPLVIDAPLPILSGDEVSLLGPEGSIGVDWHTWDGKLSISIEDSELEAANVGDIAWVFKIAQNSRS